MPGFRQVEYVPFAGTVSALTPQSKNKRALLVQVTRTDTAGVLKAVLPADTSITGISFVGPASNAGTSAVISVGTTTAANEIHTGVDVKTSGGKNIASGSGWSNNYPNIVDLPATQDIQIYFKYTESGTASSAGGPWKALIEHT